MLKAERKNKKTIKNSKTMETKNETVDLLKGMTKVSVSAMLVDTRQKKYRSSFYS